MRQVQIDFGKLLIVLFVSLCVYAAPDSTKTYAQSAKAETPSSTDNIKPIVEEASAGNLLVAPTRVVFSGRDRSAELILKNQGTTPTTYRLSLFDLDIADDGSVTPTENYAMSAAEYIRFSPRQVTLEPGAMQKVKLLLRKPMDLAAGEYRSHLKFSALPNKAMGEDVEAQQVAEGISVKLIPLIGLSIPVIAQHGELDANANMSAKREGNKLLVKLNRSGKRSLIGNIYVQQNGEIIAHANSAVLLPKSSGNITITLPEDTADAPLSIEFIDMHSKDKTPLTKTTI